MRALVTLPADDLERLDRLARRQQISRAEGVRRAVAEYLARHGAADEAAARAFGLWKARAEDGVAYQRRLRREWAE